MSDNHFALHQGEVMMHKDQHRFYKKHDTVKQYQIVQGRVDEVEREVQLLLAQGWVCQGGASHYQDWFAQAMMRDAYEQQQTH